MNFDQQKTTSITNTTPVGTNGKPIPQQVNDQTENFTGGGGGTNGVLGVTQGVPGAATSGATELHEDLDAGQQRVRPGLQRRAEGAREPSTASRSRSCSTARW